MKDQNEPLTSKQTETLNIIESGDLTFVVNEDKCTAWYVKDGRKVRVAYGTYLAFWYNKLIYEVSSDLDKCIFQFKLIHQ